MLHEMEIDESELVDFVRENHRDKLSSEEAHEFMIAMLKTRAEHHKKKDIRKQIIYFDGSMGDQLVWEYVDRMIDHQERINDNKNIPKYKVVMINNKLCKETDEGWIILTPAEKKHWNNLNEAEKHAWSS